MGDRFSQNEWAFAWIMGVQAVLILALELYILVQWQIWVTPAVTQVIASYLIPIDMAIVIFACLYTALLSLDAIYYKNNIQLLAICVANCLTLVFAALQYDGILDEVKTLPLARDRSGNALVNTDRDFWSYAQPAGLMANIVIGICIPLACLFAYRIHKDYKWAVYRLIHGDTTIKVQYLAYEVFLVLTKLNFFFSIAFIIQYNLIDVHFEEPEYSLTMALIPAILVFLLLGIWFVRSEKKWAMLAVLVCYVALIAYFLSRIIVLCGSGPRANVSGKGKMLLFSISALVFTVLSLVCAVQCVLNFDHGLKSVIVNSAKLERESYQFQTISNLESNGRHSRLGLD